MNSRLTLGITSIGDLLINKKITNTDDDAIKEVDLTIPEYQRPYKWTTKNVNQLLEDIEEAMNTKKKEYRVGTLILHLDKEDGKYKIVDGLQRTITFSLLLKCLDQEHDFLKQTISRNRYSLYNIKNNYRTIERRLAKNLVEENDKNKSDWLEYIKNNCELIVVITEDISEAFQFFDSQNARGKALYPHDLLKAYHLREMNNADVKETERIVKMWEELDQKALSTLFNEYLYRIKEWVRGNRSDELTEHNIDIFKGVSSKDNFPFAQYYKGAFAYANELNCSHVPFVTGIQKLSTFQINAPIIAGKAFFEFTKHYFDIIADIKNNNKFEGYFIIDNPIVKTLNLPKHKNGTGYRITRLMYDTAILLYVDRFCPVIPSKVDIDYLEKFVVYAFVWAYSMRAQYRNVGWLVAQNYVMGTAKKDNVVNDFNIYKVIAESDSPSELLSKMEYRIVPLRIKISDNEILESKDSNNVCENYLYHFKDYKFLVGEKNGKE